jgi:hypothetical protein
MKKLCALSLGFVFLLSGCSSAPLAADKAKENQIAQLKESVCEITRITGKDTVNSQDKVDVWNNGVVPSYPPRPSDEVWVEKTQKFNKDFEKLESLVGPWLDPIDGTGWLKFCNS